MDSSAHLETRIRQLKTSDNDGKCVLYIMSRDQRVRDNHALLAAQKRALELKLPLAVIFCLYDKVGKRSREQYQFMLDGLSEVEATLSTLHIPFMMLIGEPSSRLMAVIGHTKPSAIYFDFSPLRGPRKVVSHIANSADCDVFVVDTHNIVPVHVVSDKQEVGAYTLRPKIHRLIATYLAEPESVVSHPFAWPGRVQKMSELQPIISEVLNKQRSSGVVHLFSSGENAANRALEYFISEKLQHYGVDRNDPSNDCQSDLSPYLHFGQLSSLRVALLLREEAHKQNSDIHLLASSKMPTLQDTSNERLYSCDALLEELIVRKELADNFCYYSDFYDALESAASWAKITLDEHRRDTREQVYSLEQLESASTHDTAWNAAQVQLTRTGKMHGYMRMYWAKKILEWTENPEQAIEYLIYLNDFYSLDGGDPNGYAGILWSIAGIHDRPWAERAIFGKIRYMNYGGLKTKI